MNFKEPVMNRYDIAVLVGSLRKDSFNRRLALGIEKLAPPGFSFRHVEIGDLPHYNQDDEGNPPESVQRLKREILTADGLLFLTPEYNRSIPGVLKNAIDHASRPYGKGVFIGKPAGILGVSIGVLGTALAQQHLRNILASTGSVHSDQGRAVRCGRRYWSGQSSVPADLDGSLRCVGCEARLPIEALRLTGASTAG